MTDEKRKLLLSRLIDRGEKDLHALTSAFELCRANDDHVGNKQVRILAKRHVDGGRDRDNAYDLYSKALLFDAPGDFDAFMLYSEIRREPKEQFWLPRRKKLIHICQALQGLEDDRLDELFLSMPPRTGKTTITLFFLLWIMLRDSERSNLFCSYSEPVVKVFYKGLLEILNDTTTYAWNDIFRDSSVVAQDSKDLLINLDRAKRYPSITCRSLYGTLNGACDCRGYLMGDDLLSGYAEAVNKDRLDTAWFSVNNNYLPRAKENAKRLWIGTRWSLFDPQGRRLEMLENDPRFSAIRWKAINVPALDENDESNFYYGFGEGFSTKYYLMRRASFEKTGDMASWLAQYQGEPIERDGAVFNPTELRYYNGVLPEATPDRIFMAVDPAWGGGDYVAAPVCYQFGDDLYVADVVYDNGDKRITQPLIVAAVKKHGVQAVTVEATRTTASYTEDIDQLLKEQGIRVNMQSSISHYTGTGKRQRIFDKAPDIRERMLFLADGHRTKAYSQFMACVFSFTVTGKAAKHDDAPDSLAMAVNMAFFAGRRAVVFERPF